MPLVGLVVVSHSRALARAAVSLASEMLHDSPVRIAVAAGLDEDTLGTDAVAIKEAIEQVDGPAGVVVLMDLGSAVLSAELALELLEDPDARDRITLSAGPLVEGLVVAAVAAAGGARRVEVAAEAQNALLGKAAQLTPSGVAPSTEVAPTTQADEPVTVTGEFTVANIHGLHARPAARLVSELRGLDAQVRLRNLSTGAGPLPAGSLSRVATLGALRGHRVEVLASGRQATEAVEQVLALAARQFDEPLDDATESAQAPVPVQSGQARSGQAQSGQAQSGQARRAGPLPASPGIGIGPVRLLTYAPPASAPAAARRGQPSSPADEWRHVETALAAVRGEIGRHQALARQTGPQEARIFDAHLLLLDDDEVIADVKARLASGADAVTAWVDALAVVERQWSELEDPYLRARAEDVRAVGAQVVSTLAGAAPVAMSGPGVLVAKELTPGQAAELDRDCVQGIVLADGSPSSHAAILARSRGIPAVVDAGSDVLGLAEGTLVALDGSTGELIVDPPAATVAEFRRRAAELAARQSEHRAAAGTPARTADGARVEVAANVGSRADALTAAADGADSAGLVRTEFLFLDREVAPDVEEQVAEYLAIAEALPGRRITLRTLDVGGDKPLSYLPMPAEDNPFLGHRGIRLTLDRRELLLVQLTAICEVARQAPVNVLFPMVSTVTELRQARRVLDEAAGVRGLPEGLRVGVMVEVPAAALKIATFLPHLDFLSVGTNDLTQYTLAAERGNAAVAALFDPLDPGVLRLIGRVCEVAGPVPVAVCGEVAADPAAVPLLIGLGARELSVSPRSVPSVKARVRELDVARCAALARTALDLEDAAAVRELVGSALSC
ncbi:MAG TPA: phosphoenolpyruvate--protein phosphotransferase [Jatrophihabitans sp.]|uniref:phosphoenolpyruvate--protein phosphotransferase n=1 Tax=Jatrophihabitans sp. TaxID=1932789 RepID=UPI002EDCD601